MVISDNYISTLQVIVLFCYGIINAIGFLFYGSVLTLTFCECMWQECYGEFCFIVFLESCAPHASSEASVYTIYFLSGLG